MTRVLLVDDDPSLRAVLALVLEDVGYEVTTAEDGRVAAMQYEAAPPDLLVCDVNMPHLDGFSLCRSIRERGDDTPIILLTSRDSEVDEALGLDLGADDYITKPASNRVLVARCAALLRRRSAGKRDPQREVTCGLLRLDPDRLEATYSGHPIALTVTEFRLVEALAARAGVVQSRAQLLRAVRGDDSVVAERLVDTYIRSLRRKFAAAEPSFAGIETRVGAGYRWRDDA